MTIFHRSVALVVLIIAMLPGCGPQESRKNAAVDIAHHTKDGAAPERETLEVCFVRGARVGFTETAVYRDVLDGQAVQRIECRNEIQVKRYGQPTQMKTRSTSIEKPNGELLRFESIMEMGPTPKRTTGRVVGKRLEMETEEGGKKTPAVLSWSPAFGGFDALEQSLRGRPMQPGERRTLQSLMPDFLQMATFELFARNGEKIALPDGTRELLRIDAVAILPDGQKIAFTYWADRAGEVLKTHMAGMDLDSVRTTKDEALRKNAGELFDINVETAVKLDRAIPHPHETKKIRYRLRLADEDPAKAFPVGPTQQMKSLDAHTCELTVFAIRAGEKDGNADAPAEKPGDADRVANSMIQSDDPLVVSLAAEAAGIETDPWRTALKLEKFVHDYIKLKDFTQVFASAAEAAKSREGDCTEHGVLLAALCRARKIPARVAVGLVYTERPGSAGRTPEFAYHLWTEAYLDGRWIPLDATLGRGGIGAAHLKVAHSNLQGASMYSSFLPVVQVVGRLKIEVLEVE